jgi:hypothetical protein
MTKPQFIHDCDKCEFKGIMNGFDVYFCPKCDEGTWIARYSSEISEYASYPTFILGRLSKDTLAINPFKEDTALNTILTFYREAIT